MPRVSVKNGNGAHRHAVATSKYDANNKVLSQTYGAFADLRRELADTKNVVCEREELLRSFATCPDSQRSWLLLEDYFEKLSLCRKDFASTEWWPLLKACYQRLRTWLGTTAPQLEAQGDFFRQLARQTTADPLEWLAQPAHSPSS